MALGKYARIDGHNSSRYCVTIVIVVFISTCFLGAWMAMSTSIGPLGLGVHLQQFMGGMPKKVNLNDTDLHEDALKVNDSQSVVQDDSNLIMQENVEVTPTEPQSLDVAQNDEIVPTVVEESFSLNVEDNKGPEEKNSGPPDEADTSNQEVPTEQYVDSAVQPHDSDSQTGPNKETREYPEIIPSAWINAKKMQDKMVNQTEKPIKEQSEILRREPTNVPSGLVSGDEKEMSNETSSQVSSNRWKVCNVTAGPDYIPCLDNIQAIKKLQTTRHYEHRERHCPDEAPVCLVPLPAGYKTPIKWPKSRDMIWFSNVPHTRLVEYKGAQNWVKVYDRYLTFPGGGTQFTFGALHYIDYLEKSVPDIAWGKQSRVVLDVGCGVASFGGYLFERDVLTMSLAPKDEHEAQVQFALERGIPAISAVMGTTRLPFPSMVFDIVHCARCRVPWHVEGGKLLLELNRLLRPGGYFIWSATPVYRKDSTNVGIWKEMSELMKSICWELVKVERDSVNRKAAAIFRKPVTNNCYDERQKNDPPFCEESDDPSKAWYTPLQACIHKVPTNPSERGSQWPPLWPSRLNKTPYWMKSYESYGDFNDDYDHWKQVVTTTYLNGSGIDWSSVRNVMDMRASYGGFAAALKDLKVWVMNVVPVNSSDTLPIIYERGLFGMYHDWCESFSTYPRSYDLLHANHLFSDLRKRCSLVAVMAEVDRILRPGGWLIVRDDAKTVSEVENMANSLHWNIKFTHSNDKEEVFSVEKTMWRPTEVETIASAIG
ncbi:putative methyltransferase PMT24 [Silene latifolia]|uniref:putative methyltransferase PMT24 n=1 Tax=Silene latifolia TaxID=37657 RepID=UPI003D787075